MADFVLVTRGRPCCPPDPLHRGAASQPGALHRPDRAPPVAAYHHLGEDDPIAVRAMALRLGEARPDATLELLSGVGHYPMVEAPERFIAFLDQAFAPAG